MEAQNRDGKNNGKNDSEILAPLTAPPLSFFKGRRPLYRSLDDRVDSFYSIGKKLKSSSLNEFRQFNLCAPSVVNT